jgi:D-beta-D-heptose 7-phosphate kinase/D-beta-D-heptose 1-phosphate adenosyltransferase
MGVAQARHGHQILRIDRERREPLPESARREIIRRLPELVAAHDIILVADYAKGVCVPELLTTLITLARAAGKRVIIDPARGVDYRGYTGASCVTPNRVEAQDAAGRPIAGPDDALRVAVELRRRFDLEAAIVTLDRDGMALAVAGETDARIFPTRSRQVYDITGAGDMVLAVLGICLATGAPYDAAVRLANVAGGLEVERVGVVAVTRDEILAELEARRGAGQSKILPLESLVAAIDARRRLGQRIVMTNGCFDLLHRGHLMALEDAAALGDCLVVAINGDASVRRLKGPTRPILSELDRASLMAAFAIVDYVTIFQEDTPLDVVRSILPDVLVKGASYANEYIAGREEVEANGGRVVLGRLLDGVSTTDLVRRIRELG